MKFLLTSAGIKNTSIHNALVDLLGKPIAESNALCIPTAGYGHPQGSPGGAWRFISGRATTPMCELGWKSLGVLELTALFLPLAAWIIASRRGEWDQLLAATVVTLAIAVPLLVIAALVEVYVSPHLFVALTGIRPPVTRTFGTLTVTVLGPH